MRVPIHVHSHDRQATRGRAAAHVVVVGNEKGGSGKSTIALHLAVGLMQLGFRVMVADFDERQRSLLRYLENRLDDGAAAGPLPCPAVYEPPARLPRQLGGDAELARLEADLRAARRRADFLVIDTPGAASPSARLAHSLADTLVTPMNDSWLDLDVLARLGPGGRTLLGPSHYSTLVLEQRRLRLERVGTPFDWILLRNRLAPIPSANHARLGQVLEALASALNLRLAPGLGERVVYRELFLTGRTVLDPLEPGPGMKARLTASEMAARLEVRRLMLALRLPQVSRKLTAEAVTEAASELDQAS